MVGTAPFRVAPAERKRRQPGDEQGLHCSVRATDLMALCALHTRVLMPALRQALCRALHPRSSSTALALQLRKKRPREGTVTR